MKQSYVGEFTVKATHMLLLCPLLTQLINLLKLMFIYEIVMIILESAGTRKTHTGFKKPLNTLYS